LIPPCLYPQPAQTALGPDAPPRILADNVLFLVRFLDPGQRSFAAFAKRDSLLAGPLELETMPGRRRKQTKPTLFHANEIVLRCNFAQASKRA
jgi:hypothetical protein